MTIIERVPWPDLSREVNEFGGLELAKLELLEPIFKMFEF